MENKYPLFSNWFSNTYHIGKHSQESISRNQNMNILAPVSTLIHFFIIFPFRLHSFFLCVCVNNICYLWLKFEVSPLIIEGESWLIKCLCLCFLTANTMCSAFLCLLHNIVILTGCPWSEMPKSYNNWPCLEEDSVVQTGIFDLGHTVVLVFFTVLAFLFLLSWVLLILCLFLFVLFVNRLTTPWAIRGRGFILCL